MIKNNISFKSPWSVDQGFDFLYNTLQDFKATDLKSLSIFL